MADTYPQSTVWRFSALRSGFTRESPLTLYWEPNGSSLSDDWVPDEIDAHGLWARWMKWLDKNGFDSDLGKPWVRIYWFVDGDATFEGAPFAPKGSDWAREEDFLTHYTWPVDVTTGERVNWARLPVVEKRWSGKRGDKGGFVQEALRWKPAALQPLMHVEAMAHAAGLPGPSS